MAVRPPPLATLLASPHEEKTDASLNSRHVVLPRVCLALPVPLADLACPSRPHALVVMTHPQTRRSTRRSLANEQGVENDLSNRVGRSAAASTSLAVGKPPAQKAAVASTSTAAAGTRRTATTTRAALGDKVRPAQTSPPRPHPRCMRTRLTLSSSSPPTPPSSPSSPPRPLRRPVGCGQRHRRRSRQAPRLLGRHERGQGQGGPVQGRRQQERDRLVGCGAATVVPHALVDRRRDQCRQGGGRRRPRPRRRRQR